MGTQIHKTAIVEAGAKLDEGVQIGPYCVIGAGAKIGKGTRLESHVVISGDTQLGADCHLFPFVSIGSEPQDMKYQGEKTKIVIGNNNRFGQTATVELGTAGGGGVTRIGNNGLYMIGCHIGHDSQLGDAVILANHVTLAGHVRLGSHVYIGGMTPVHQFTRIGDYAMAGGASAIKHDLIPYGAAAGNPATLNGLNLVGLRRHKFPTKVLHELRQVFREVFVNTDGLLETRVTQACQKWQSHKEIMRMLDFMRDNDKQRGLCLPAAV